MVIFSRNKSFRRNILFSVSGIFILFVSQFCYYQYTRETNFKRTLLHSRLQMYSYDMMRALDRDSILTAESFYAYLENHEIEGLQIEIVDMKGRVVLDSRRNVAVDTIGNLSRRKDIQQALHKGDGYAINRSKVYPYESYFYSATRFDNFIIRASLPFSAPMAESLKIDYSFVYYALLLTILMAMVIYLNSTRIGHHIGHLREFAMKAEQGIELDHDLERRLPDDELSDISHTIITLFWKFRHAEEDKARIKQQLTQNAAHELKTPASSIHGYLECILDDPDMPADQRQHFIERCYAQSERLSKLLQDMATLTKLNESPENIDRSQKVDVKQLIASVLDDTALQLQEKNITPVFHLPQSVTVHGDASILYSIFRNLVDNVVSYATDATHLTISCTLLEHETDLKDNEDKSYYDFKVSDDGVGVEPKHISHLFERFYRVDKGRSRKLGGTGLGLSIVKNAVAAHGGICYAEPTPNGGLTIHFTLEK